MGFARALLQSGHGSCKGLAEVPCDVKLADGRRISTVRLSGRSQKVKGDALEQVARAT